VDVWTYAFVPELGRFGPINLYQDIRVPADSLGRNDLSEHVPGAAPAGDYVFVAYVGDYPGTIVDSSYFYFSKSGSVGGDFVGLGGGQGWLEKAYSDISNLPTDCALLENYPNPFNARTTISYQLPAEAHVRLEVYNTLGQRIATLVDVRQEAGYRSVVWDASEVSSGVYFYKLTTGDFSESKRMLLVK